jgi:hypothetical protein
MKVFPEWVFVDRAYGGDTTLGFKKFVKVSLNFFNRLNFYGLLQFLSNHLKRLMILFLLDNGSCARRSTICRYSVKTCQNLKNWRELGFVAIVIQFHRARCTLAIKKF